MNENSVRAELDGGLLKITLDKREEVKPRKIQITAGAGNGNHTVGPTKGNAGQGHTGQKPS